MRWEPRLRTGSVAIMTLRAGDTREQILTAAERLFAEHGVFAVSNRQVGEAAGQGDNAAVGYHFGTKTDLVRAIVRRHTERIERIRHAPCRPARHGAATGLIDATVGLWTAPVTAPIMGHGGRTTSRKGSRR